MNTSLFKLKQTALSVALGFSLLTMPLFLNDFNGTGLVNAAADSEKGQQGNKGQGDQGQKGKGGSSGGKGMSKVLDADSDDDSDRPPWAGTPGGEGRPGGGGNADSGTTKGDNYGDLIVLLRDPETGEPIVNADGELLICLDSACTETVATEDGEVPAGVTSLEVEFGRAAVARAPDRVIDKALNDAITKLTATDAIIGLDSAGRITVTVNGVTSTIDSPLENLALYIDLLTGLADTNSTSQTEAALGDLATLDVAASLLAGLADKTGTITIDYVVYNNVIAGVVDPTDYYDYSGFIYARDYPTDYTYFYSVDDGTTVQSATLNINDYLTAINGSLPDGSGVLLFSAAADDALEVIELMHTQIYFITEPLPGTAP